jgi:hypothetical protein
MNGSTDYLVACVYNQNGTTISGADYFTNFSGALVGTSGSGGSLPTQTGNSGKYLTTDGTNASWTNTPASVAVLAYDLSSSTGDPTTITGTAWTTRAINTKVTDPDSMVTLASNAFTLDAGTYLIRAHQSFYSDGGVPVAFKGRIRNTTDSTTAIVGLNCRLHIALGESAASQCPVEGVVTITGTKTFVLQYYSTVTHWSASNSTTSSGEVERLVQVTIQKLK